MVKKPDFANKECGKNKTYKFCRGKLAKICKFIFIVFPKLQMCLFSGFIALINLGHRVALILNFLFIWSEKFKIKTIIVILLFLCSCQNEV